MAVLKNRAKMSTSTTGTGTITLGSAEDGYQSFADAGVANADVVRYVIEDGSNFEIGTGTYTATGTTLSRTVSESSNSDAAINLSGSATVFIGATAEDIPALYAENYDGTSTKPSATGTNTIAIGTSAIAGNADDGIAIGRGANCGTATQNIAIGAFSDCGFNSFAMALGRTAQATGGSSLALGVNSAASHDNSVAIGKSNSNGDDSFAAQIVNNTTSYGAQGNFSIAMGKLAKATGTESTAIGRENIASGERSFAAGGYNATASGTDTVAIGYQAQATATYAVALGYSNEADGIGSLALGYNSTASSQNSVVIGNGVQSTAANQVSIGGTTDTVRISETYTLPTADGTNGQVLTTNGAGAVTFADAGGGGGGDPDLYRDNAVSATTPTASGDNAVAIGSNARATGSRSVSIGFNTNSTQNYNVSIGHAAASAGVGGLAIGYDARADASYANAIGRSLANGQDSLAGAIGTNSGSYGATATSSVAMGYQAKATNTGAVAIGYQPQATGLYSIAIGDTNTSGREAVGIGENNTASGLRNTVIGYGSTGTADYSTTLGVSAADQGIKSRFALSGSTFNNDGDSQAGMFPLRTATTDATATALTTDGNAASTNNQIILPNNSAYAFHGTIVARQQAADGTACAAWKVEGLIRREGSAGTTVLVNSATTVIDNTPNWGMALSADTTNGGLAITVTGAASTDVRWVATIHSSEVTYA